MPQRVGPAQSAPKPMVQAPKPKMPPGVKVKVLTFNLYWWKLFDQGKPGGFYKTAPGNGASALNLVSASGRPVPYDVMGFQECEDENWVLRHAGLWGQYTTFRDRACCMAFRKATWQLESRGVGSVAKDHYGER